VGGKVYFCYLVPFLLGRDLFVMKGNQVLADRLALGKKKKSIQMLNLKSLVRLYVEFKLSVYSQINLLFACLSPTLIVHTKVKQIKCVYVYKILSRMSNMFSAYSHYYCFFLRFFIF